jgi:hypothetical protein
MKIELHEIERSIKMTTVKELEKRIIKIEKQMAAEASIWERIAAELEKNLRRNQSPIRILK